VEREKTRARPRPAQGGQEARASTVIVFSSSKICQRPLSFLFIIAFSGERVRASPLKETMGVGKPASTAGGRVRAHNFESKLQFLLMRERPEW